MANEQNWSEYVNTNILRNGTSWSNPLRFIEDETRSGKRKRRLCSTMEKKSFSIKMRFSETEYNYFIEWFEDTLQQGLYPFYFPQIDKSGNTVIKLYRFSKDGIPKFENSSGKCIDCTMIWEEI